MITRHARIKRSAPPRKKRKGVRRGRIVDQAYLAWMGQQYPLVGSGPVTLHHVNLYGSPKNDRRVVPLPAEFHLYEFGMECIERLGKAKFQERFGIDLEAAILDYNERYDAEHAPEPPCECRLAGDQADASDCELCNPSSKFNRMRPVPPCVLEASNGNDACPF